MSLLCVRGGGGGGGGSVGNNYVGGGIKSLFGMGRAFIGIA